jgi:hypothetical protein
MAQGEIKYPTLLFERVMKIKQQQQQCSSLVLYESRLLSVFLSHYHVMVASNSRRLDRDADKQIGECVILFVF